jgi:hypothetical protein
MAAAPSAASIPGVNLHERTPTMTIVPRAVAAALVAAAALTAGGPAADASTLAIAAPVASAAAPSPPAPVLTFAPPSVGPICVDLGPIIIGGAMMNPGLNVCSSGASLPPMHWGPSGTPVAG